MADAVSSSKEQVVELSGQSAGQASARVVDLATSLGYTVAATAPGSFRLARTGRKMLVMKRVESATVAVSEDRNGTRARIVGDVDHAFVEHLTASATSNRPAPATPTPMAPPGPSGAAAPLPLPSPSWGAPAPAAQPAPAAPPPVRPAGLITTPSWISGSEPMRSEPPVVPRPEPYEPELSDDDVDARTVARSTLRSQQPAGPTILLPDGRRLLLGPALVVGRRPDPDRGPTGAELVPLADPSLSKTHALIEVDRAGIWITDLHSTNGTALEAGDSVIPCDPGERVRLRNGAVVRIGGVVVTFQDAV